MLCTCTHTSYQHNVPWEKAPPGIGSAGVSLNVATESALELHHTVEDGVVVKMKRFQVVVQNNDGEKCAFRKDY